MHTPNAIAYLRGSREFPDISGAVRFYRHSHGTFVAAQIEGLPKGGSGIFGFHIHSGNSCTGNADDPFFDTGAHYDTKGRPHPYHAGDMPPLFGGSGFAFSSFVTDRFSADSIIGRTVVVHSMPDDFTSQPAGNAGKKIACGVIEAVYLQ